jgi:hypothetical protein
VLQPEIGGKLDEIRKTFKAKSAKSARSLEFACLQIAQAVSRAALSRCDLVISETVRAAFRTLQALAEAARRANAQVKLFI